MASKKNKGPLLTSKFRGGESDSEREIPPEFRAAMALVVTEQEVPLDVDPDALSDTVLSSKTEQTRTDERKKRTATKAAGPVTLVEKDTNEKKQVVTRTRKMQATSTAATAPTATKDVQQKNLGNGQTIEEVSEVPEVFADPTYSKEIPDVVPPEFRVAVPTTENETSVEGTAASPTLGSGELARRESTINKLVKRIMVRARAAISLPISLVSYRTSQTKQVETVTTTLKAFETPTPPTAKKDVNVKNLGDGTMLEEVAQVPNVFQEKTRQVGTPQVIPERFRAASGISTNTDVVEGTVPDTVTLGTNEVERVEQEVTEFAKRVKVTVKDPATTPTLEGQEFQQRLGVTVGYEERLEASGVSLGDQNTDVQPISDTLDIAKEYDLSALSSYSKIFAGMTTLEVPPSLEFLTPYFDGRDSSGQFTGTIGDCHWFDSGSWSYSLRGEGQGSAAIVAHVQHSVKQIWGRHVSSRRVVFFMTPPVVIADILAALTTFLGAPVTVMPSFKPTSITILLVSEAISLRAEAQEHVQDGGSGASAEEHSEYGGYGDSREHSKTIEAIVIPPCLHGSISFDDSQAAVADAAAHAGSNSSTPAAEVVFGRVLASGSASVPDGVPSNGLVVVALDPEPFYTKIMYHAEVVDMATV